MRSTNRLVLGAAQVASVGTSALAVASDAEIVDVRTEPPIVVRRAGGRVLFGAAAAGPLGGDRIDVDVVVGDGVRADVGTVGATMALPGRVPATSSTDTTISVGAGSHLDWRPEPLISVVGSDHRSSLFVALSASSTCRLTEEYALGRSGESAGHLTTTVRVERGGRPLLHHAETFGPGQVGGGSVAVGPSTGHAIAQLVVGGVVAGGAETVVGDDRWAGVFPLSTDSVLVLAVATDRPAALELVERFEPS